MRHDGERHHIDAAPNRRASLVPAWLAAACTLLLWAPGLAGQETPSGDTVAADPVPTHVDNGKAVIGKHLFRSFCASCHGQSAVGDGSIADMLRVAPADLTRLAAENDGVFPFQRSMDVIDGRTEVQGHGTAEMPAWGDAFAEISESEVEVKIKISQLVHYIWSVQGTGEASE